MSDGKLGLSDVVRGGFVRPSRVFEAWQRGEVEARPFVVYALGFLAAGTTTGLELGGGASLVVAAVALPLSWFVGTGVLHLLVRLLRGSGTLKETKVAVGFGSAPRLLGLFGLMASAGEPLVYLVWLVVVGELWSYVATTIGLVRLHRLRVWRAVLVVVLPFVVPVALALGLRAFVLEAFKVPSGAMQPTIQIQDHLFVTKSTYGLLEKVAPARGEVVVFTYPDPDPENLPQDFIKRVIALPGDTLEVEKGAPIINGFRVPRCHLGRRTVESALEGEQQLDLFVEFLQGHTYLVEHDLEHESGKQGPYKVAPGEFWVLGDARNNSADSRVWRGGKGGGVPFANLRGRAWFLWLPPERIGVKLHGRPVLPQHLRDLEPELARCLASAPSLAASTPPAAR